MTWLLALVLALAAFVIAAFVLRAPRKGWESIGAALLLGVAGYALQASPGVPAAPKQARETLSGDPAALVKARSKVTTSGIPPLDRWVVIADAMARNGQFGDAAEVLRGAISRDPKNAEAWLAMANALVQHADGLLTPAALYAYRRASEAAPQHPGPPYFLGMALAQSGRFAEAQVLWRRLLEQTPVDAPWRADLTQQLGRLEALIAMQSQAPQPSASPPR
jgi:cytochrome c-type biogenesis protein CcmH